MTSAAARDKIYLDLAQKATTAALCTDKGYCAARGGTEGISFRGCAAHLRAA